MSDFDAVTFQVTFVILAYLILFRVLFQVNTECDGDKAGWPRNV